MANTVCHIEYRTADLAISQRFCERAFGWEFRSFGGDMTVFSAAGAHIGGFVKGDPPERANPEVHYRVDSLDSFLAEAQSLGARVGNAKHEIPGVSWYASIIAPDGNEFGLVEFTNRD